MHVVQIITRSDNIGGAQIHVRDLSLGLIKRGVTVHLLVGGEGPFVAEAFAAGIPVTPVPDLVRPISPARDWLAFRQLRRELKRLEPDLVAVHTTKAALVGRLAARTLRVPAVLTAHGWSYIVCASGAARPFYVLTEKMLSRLTAGVITVCEHDRRFCLARRMAKADRVVVVKNGIPDAPKAANRSKNRSTRVVMTARLEKPKNPFALLDSLADLRDFCWQLDLIGGGPLKAQVEQKTAGLGLAERVRLLGDRCDVGDLLGAADVFALVSDWEGLPLSILEAMRAGLPVVASDVGGVRETVADGENGFLVPAGDRRLLTDRLGLLLADPELRLKMGAASRRKYEECFTLQRMVDETLNIYQQVLREGKKGA